jgi:Protein of unknown function (DUF2283)
MVKYNYDEEADVLYISFDRSEHVTGVELTPNVLLRLDTGLSSGEAPRALGLTFVSYSKLRQRRKGKPLTVSLDKLRNLPDDVWHAVVEVVTSSPVSEILQVAFSISLPVPEIAHAEAPSA